jgi:V8-like Glu-specific endopeptidase
VDPALLPPALPPAPADEPAFDPAVGDQAELEQIVNSEDNFLDIDALAGAIYTAQAVGRIELPRGRAHGTGFLVGPDLMLTNYHVFKSKDVLASAVVRFDYHANADGVVTQGRIFDFQPDFYVGSPDTELDFALVRIKGEPLAERKLQPGDEGLGYLELLRRGRHRGYLLVSPSLIVEHERVNIIQHPNGNPQKVVLTQNYVLATMSDTRVHYLADTLPGSSGSPVLNRYWEVVALHHSGGAHPPQKASSDLQKLLKGVYKFNEGIPIRAILPQIERYLPRK